MMFEVLYLPLMFLGSFQAVEGTQVLSLACLRVYLTGIDPVLSCFQFAYHNITDMEILCQGWAGFMGGCAIFSSLIPENST